MQTVWKFVLAIDDSQTVQMPRGAQLLSVANQYEAVCLWALVNPKESHVARRIFMVGTGHEIIESGPFVGSALMRGGEFVFHVFDGGEWPS